jgi:hypothetical protein
MKKIVFPLSILILFSIASCKKDGESIPIKEEKKEIILTHEFNLDGTVLIGQNGAISDFGLSKDSLYYNYFFGISDAKVFLNNNGSLGFLSTSKFWISFLTESYGSSFSTGEYPFISDISSIPLKKFIKHISVVNKGKRLPVTGGTITILGGYPTYTIVADLTLEGGKKFTGDFTGKFDIK